MDTKTQSCTPVRNNPPPEPDSTHGLTQTLGEVRELRDELLSGDERSRAGLVLAQITLILQRLQHDIPSGSESFQSLLRVTDLAGREKVEV